MSDVRRYRKRPVECEALKLESYGDFARARDWINDNGGKAYFTPGVAKSLDKSPDVLSIITIDGNIADMFEGWYVVRGIQGEFYPCRADIFEASHEVVEEPVEAEALTGTGSYVVGRSDGAMSLQGGAAKRLPVD